MVSDRSLVKQTLLTSDDYVDQIKPALSNITTQRGSREGFDEQMKKEECAEPTLLTID